MEQYGMMSVGFAILIPLAYFIKEKRKPKAIHYVNALAALAGFLTVVLAPGNLVRMDSGNFTKPLGENFVAALTTFCNTKALLAVSLILLMTLSYWLITFDVKWRLLKVFHVLMTVGLWGGYLLTIFILFNRLGADFHSHIILTMGWRLFDLLYLFAMIYVPLMIFLLKKDIRFAVLAIIALGSVFMLFIASVSYRAELPAIMIIIPVVSLTVMDFTARREAAADRFKDSLLAKGAAVVVSLAVIVTFCAVLRGFYRNDLVYDENERRMEEYRASPADDGELWLLSVADPACAGYSFNISAETVDPIRLDTFKARNGIEDANVFFESGDSFLKNRGN